MDIAGLEELDEEYKYSEADVDEAEMDLGPHINLQLVHDCREKRPA